PLIFCLISTLGFSTELVQTLQAYQADYGALRRLYSNPLSDEYSSRILEFHREYLSALGKVNYDPLSDDGKIDYVLLRNFLEKELAELALEKEFFDEVSGVLAFAEPLEEFSQGRRRAKKPEPQVLAATWNEVAKQVDDQLKNLASSPKYTSWQKADLAASAVE